MRVNFQHHLLGWRRSWWSDVQVSWISWGRWHLRLCLRISYISLKMRWNPSLPLYISYGCRFFLVSQVWAKSGQHRVTRLLPKRFKNILRRFTWAISCYLVTKGRETVGWIQSYWQLAGVGISHSNGRELKQQKLSCLGFVLSTIKRDFKA